MLYDCLSKIKPFHSDHFAHFVDPRTESCSYPVRQSLFSWHTGTVSQYPNVCWTGSQPFARLPSYLRLIHVGLTPYADTPFNQTSFPLKTLEYLAAGRSVVATDLPAARSLETDAITLVGSCDPEGFATATDRRLDEAVVPSQRAAWRAFAMQHSWERRAQEFAQLLGLEMTTGS